MEDVNEELWIDTRLSVEEMNFLRDAIKNKYENDSKTHFNTNDLIVDKDNWFFESVLKKTSEKLFYRNFEKGEPPPIFGLGEFWVNYQKQYEFNPLHNHIASSCWFGFVVFVKIPTDWKEQHDIPSSVHSNSPNASDFQFVWSENNSELCKKINFRLSPEDEGRMLFFPAWLLHQVYPFYGTKEKRITISGNIHLQNSISWFSK